MEQLKTLTDELKILIHIGSHLNILNVLGAVTQDLDNGQMMFRRNYTVQSKNTNKIRQSFCKVLCLSNVFCLFHVRSVSLLLLEFMSVLVRLVIRNRFILMLSISDCCCVLCILCNSSNVRSGGVLSPWMSA